MKTPSRLPRGSRRSFIGGVAAALVAPGAASAQSAGSGPSALQSPSTGAPPPVDVTALRIAQSVTGVQQKDEALAKAAPLVARYRTHVEALRKVDVPTEVEPAFSFNPRRRPSAKPRPVAASPVRVSSGAQERAPGSEADIAFATAAQLRGWLDAGHVTSARLMRLALDRLEKHDPALGSVVTLCDVRGRAEAAQADSAKGLRPRSALHGIPYGAKDLFDSAGIRTLWGAQPYRNRAVPAADATAIARLASAGACLAAKLSTGELAIGDAWFGEPQHQDGRPLVAGDGFKGRRTRNPWDPTTGASGSSAGPAAAVAAGLVPFALATETGGSIVSPASTCGVTGLRPTYGRVSRYGAMTLRWTMDKAGVIARSVEDCGTVLAAIHGPDGLDNSVCDTPFAWRATAGPMRKLRLGIVENELFEPEAGASEKERARFPLTRAVFEAAIDLCRRAGCEIVPVTLPAYPSASLYAIHNAEAGAMFDDITRSGEVDLLEGQGPNDRSTQLRASRFISAIDYIRAQRVRALLLADMERLFESVDLFLAPPSSDSVNMTNLTGHPALVLPAGFVKSENGIEMPQNLMLTGRLDDEATLLDAGHAFQRETDWHRRRPPLFV